MKIIHAITVAAALAMPMLISEAPAQAATANQYSAAGHGRHAMMTNRPSRAIYHHRHRHMPRYRHMHRRGY